MYKSFNVYLKGLRGNKLSNGDIKIRPVRVPVAELNGSKNDLDVIFTYGQNDFTVDEKNVFRSVSMGDVIEYNNRYFGIILFGFKELNSIDDSFDEWEDAA